MVIGHHKSDWRKMPNEEAFLDAVRQQNAPAGQYNFPHCDMKQMKDPAAQERLKRGPWGAITIVAGWPNMGRMLSLWFVHLLIVSVVVAYVACHALAAGTPFAKVFQLVG